MSNMLQNTGITYFTVPNCALTKDVSDRISKRELLLYLHLWKHSQRSSTLTLTYAGTTLANQLWVAESQVTSARQGLVKLGLIQVDRVKGGYEYSLCDPDSGECISNPRLQSKGYDFDKMTATDTATYFRKRLADSGIAGITETRNGLLSCCPLCKGERPTFEVKLVGGLFHCHKCTKKGGLTHFEQQLALTSGLTITRKIARKAVCEALRACGVSDVTTGDPEATYSYCDADGEIIFEVCRFPNKHFRMRKMNRAGDYVYRTRGLPDMLYRLPQVLSARTVFICEGEKDADRLSSLQLRDCAGDLIEGTTNSRGAGKWRKVHTDALKGKRVITIGDNDARGVRHMDDVDEGLSEVASGVIRVHLPDGYKDVSEFLDANGIQDLHKLLPEDWVEGLAAI